MQCDSQNKRRAGVMAHQVKALAAKPNDLSSVLAAHMVEGDNRILHAAL